MPVFRSLLLVVLGLSLAGCGGQEAPAGALRVDLDKRNEAQLLAFYFGSFVGPDGSDPFEAGLLSEEGGTFYLFPNRLPPFAQAALDDADANGTLDWDETEAFLLRTYAEARGLPPTRAALRAEAPYAEADTAWFTVEVNGVMSVARRRVFVPMAAMRAALAGYHEQGERLIYPVGTTLVGEHYLDGAHVETTAMRKRGDGFWDFFVYGEDGTLATATSTPPRPLRAPTQCIGCHIGRRAFEPEESFPAEAPPGPHGPRALHVGPEMRNAEVVAFFDEHRKRSDLVLGVYNTLFVSKLLADRAAGRLAPQDAALLEGLRLEE